MRILSFTTLYPSRSHPQAGIFVRSRMQAMAKQAHLVVLAPEPLFFYYNRRLQRAERSPQSYQDGDVEVIRPGWVYPPLGGPLNAICLAVTLLPIVLKLHRRFKFDLIDAHFGFPTGIAAWLLARFNKVPFTITLRGSENLHIRYRWRRVLMQHALRQAACVIAVSERLRDLAISCGAPPENTFCIPNGVDSQVFRLLDRAACRAQFGFRPDVKVILTVGHLIALKGHHRVIEALNALPDVHLCIAGGAGGVKGNRSQLNDLIRRHSLESRVHFLGHLGPEVLASAMCAADVFCLASSSEGWPNVVSEALSCGTPVVATDVGAIPQMLTDQTGIIVPPDDHVALQQALACALGRSWNRNLIADQGARRSWADVGREVLDTFRRQGSF